MAAPWHQRIVKVLLYLLNDFVTTHKLGEVLFAPLPVWLWAGQIREPDLIYFASGRIKDDEEPPRGADLAMEVVSEGAKERERDLETKRLEYAKAGIPEYWIIDRQERRIIVLTLEGAEYRVHGEFSPGARATSVLLPGFSVAVSEVLAAAEGRPRKSTKPRRRR
jgi:Uma2 family endonuclease